MRGSKLQFTSTSKFRTTFRFIIATAMLMLWARTGFATQNVSLAWDASTNNNVTGYVVYYNIDGDTTTNRLDVGNVTTANVTGLANGQRYIFAVTAYTSDGFESDLSNQISVPQNTAPQISAIMDQTINESTLFSLKASGSDSDVPANALTYSLLSPPAGMSINPATGDISWTPNEAQGPSTNLITVIVTDNGLPSLTATQSFKLYVNEVNQAPVLTTPADQLIGKTTTLSVSASATDADLPANALTFSLTAKPTGMTIDANSGAISWTPSAGQIPSTNTITVKVTDNGSPNMSDSKSFVVTVVGRTTPILTVPGNQTINELTPLSVSASAVDPDVPGGSLIYSLVSAPAGMSINSSTGAINWTPTEAQGPSTNTVVVKVIDNGTPALSDTHSFVVTVNEVNSPPTLIMPADRSLIPRSTMSVAVLAMDSDIPTNTLTFAIVSAPTGVSINASTGVLTWSPASNQAPSTNTISVSVTDNGTPPLSVTNSFKVVVRTSNQNPVPSSPTIQRAPSMAVKFSVASLLGTDPDGDPLVLLGTDQFTLFNATIVTRGQWVYYSPPVGFTNSDSFGYAVSDGLGGFAIGTVTINVNPAASASFAGDQQLDGTVHLRFDGIPGRAYVIQYATDSGNPVWQTLATRAADGLGVVAYIDTPPNGSPTRIYRAVLP